jgi:hypothetical protein
MRETWRRFALYLLLLRAPLALLAIGLIVCFALLLGPSRARVRAVQVVAVAQVLAGLVGIFLHIRSNVEFELELRPGVGGWPLVIETLRGAIPALAPGSMAQLGLLGLLVCFRHPAVTGSGDDSFNQET